MKFISLFFPYTIETFDSKFNGKIYVKEFIGRKYIEVDGLMQSGRIPEVMFSKGFKHFKIKSGRPSPKRILVLGVGGGTVIKLITKEFPQTQVVAIDIDKTIVDVGRKYFELNKNKNVKIVIGDVFDIKNNFGNDYDLIVVDLFKGYDIPKKLSSKLFLLRLKKALSVRGNVMFNRLYFQKYEHEADVFAEDVKNVFDEVKFLKLNFNLLILAR